MSLKFSLKESDTVETKAFTFRLPPGHVNCIVFVGLFVSIIEYFIESF